MSLLLTGMRYFVQFCSLAGFLTNVDRQTDGQRIFAILKLLSELKTDKTLYGKDLGTFGSESQCQRKKENLLNGCHNICEAESHL